MKLLSYNIYGVKETKNPIPNFNVRKANIRKILGNLLKDDEIIICLKKKLKLIWNVV